MSCAGCSSGTKGSPKGCGSKGGCSTGGCNRLNTFDWLAGVEQPSSDDFDLAEISFKNGSRKFFFHNPPHIGAMKNDWVVVESGAGYDVGKVSLTGELVKLQLKKKKVKNNTVFHKIIRIAHERDMEKLHEARGMEQKTMEKARVISRMLDLEMKIGDVEYQGDKRKATFYYTAEGRVDFRELIRHYAKEFRVKIEMRQIGARQESARIGGLGACGRELCCSTWLTNFKSVSTSAARYQNLAINQSKLSGQCGRLKCCLNYELDTYMEVLKEFPKHADILKTEAGEARLMKMDIFKRLMFYIYKNNKATRGKIFALDVNRVSEILAMNKKGQKPEELQGVTLNDEVFEEDTDLGFADVTGQIELPADKRRKRKGRGRGGRNRDKTKSKGRTERKSATDKKAEAKKNSKTKSKAQGSKQKPSSPIKGKNTSSQSRKRSENRNRNKNTKNKPPSNNNENKK